MSRLLGRPSRWAAAVTNSVHDTAKRTGASLVPSTLISRDELADTANMFFSAIGASNIKINKKNDRDDPLQPKSKKKRRMRGPDGTIVVEAYRDRNPGSESEDTETDSGGESGDDDDFVVSDDDSVVEDTGSNASSIPDLEDAAADDEWVKLKFRHQEEYKDATSINDLDQSFQPTRDHAGDLRYKSDVTRRSSKLCMQSPAGEEEVAEAKADGTVAATTWRGESMEAVMFVPEIPEDMEASIYHTARSF